MESYRRTWYHDDSSSVVAHLSVIAILSIQVRESARPDDAAIL